MLVSLFPGVALLLGASAALLLLVLSHASPIDELDFPFFDFQDKLHRADPLDILYLLRPSVCMRTLLADISVCVASTLKRFQYSS